MAATTEAITDETRTHATVSGVHSRSSDRAFVLIVLAALVLGACGGCGDDAGDAKKRAAEGYDVKVLAKAAFGRGLSPSELAGGSGSTVRNVSLGSGATPTDSFEAAIFRVIRQTAADVVTNGLATLEEGQDGGGAFLRLVPLNPAACEIRVYPDYPTVCLGPEGHTTEMFGSEETRLHELPQLILAVVAGRYEWEHRQVTRRFLGLRLWTFTRLVGTLHTEDGPWVFTRQGGERRGAVEHRTYEPYRVQREAPRSEA